MTDEENNIENEVSKLLAEGKKVPEYLMNQYRQSKKLKETKDSGLI